MGPKFLQIPLAKADHFKKEPRSLSQRYDREPNNIIDEFIRICFRDGLFQGTKEILKRTERSMNEIDQRPLSIAYFDNIAFNMEFLNAVNSRCSDFSGSIRSMTYLGFCIVPCIEDMDGLRNLIGIAPIMVHNKISYIIRNGTHPERGDDELVRHPLLIRSLNGYQNIFASLKFDEPSFSAKRIQNSGSDLGLGK